MLAFFDAMPFLSLTLKNKNLCLQTQAWIKILFRQRMNVVLHWTRELNCPLV